MKEVKYPLMTEGIVSRETFFEILNSYDFKNIVKVKSARKGASYYYFNAPAAFDTETTSFFYKGPRVISEYEFRALPQEEQEEWKPGATMYEWTFGFMGLVTAGRTYEEMTKFFDDFKEWTRRVMCSIWKTDTSQTIKTFIYVHNLAFDFQFFRKWFDIDKTFNLKSRKPVKAETADHAFEFRCSYILTGKRLEKIGEELRKYLATKKVGDLDYKLMRHSGTPLNEEEWGYCEADIRVDMNYIQEQIEKESTILNIPMTKTGYVRRDVREKCFKDPMFVKLIKRLTIENDEFIQLMKAFQGGFTHGNANNIATGKTFHHVKSQDFTSSYPAVIVCKYFPMSKGVRIDPKTLSMKQFKKLLKTKCCLIDIEFPVLEEKFTSDHYISVSRCDKKLKKNTVEDNGRLVSGEHIRMTITELDFEIISKTYEGAEGKDIFKSGFIIHDLWIYDRGRLPVVFIKAVLDYYINKTTLKDVKGREEDYNYAKEMVNSIYGMLVTNPVRDEIEYLGTVHEWMPAHKPDLGEKLNQYNNNQTRFSFYPWGVWVTAHARMNLWTGIMELQDDYLYADTDSVKYINYDKHEEYFRSYNENIRQQMEAAMTYIGAPLDAWKPKTIKGKEKPLGYWDDEGIYDDFKTLGAKRYMTTKRDENGNPLGIGGSALSVTIAGVNKRTAVPWMIKTMDDPFKEFKAGLVIPYEACGKLMHTYIDEEFETFMIDYQGNGRRIYEKSAVQLTDAQYSLSISENYENFLDMLFDQMNDYD